MTYSMPLDVTAFSAAPSPNQGWAGPAGRPRAQIDEAPNAVLRRGGDHPLGTGAIDPLVGQPCAILDRVIRKLDGVDNYVDALRRCLQRCLSPTSPRTYSTRLAPGRVRITGHHDHAMLAPPEQLVDDP